MGGIVIIVNGEIEGVPHTWRWGGHASDVANFIKLSEISAIASGKTGDSHNGTITIDAEERKIIIDSDYFTLSKEVIRFWRCIGFDVLGRLTE